MSFETNITTITINIKFKKTWMDETNKRKKKSSAFLKGNFYIKSMIQRNEEIKRLWWLCIVAVSGNLKCKIAYTLYR